MSDKLAATLAENSSAEINNILSALSVTSAELKQRAHIFALNYAEVGVRAMQGEDVTAELEALRVSAKSLKAAAGMAVVAGITDAVESAVQRFFLAVFKAII